MRRKAFTRTSPCRHLALGLPASRMMRNKCLLLINYPLSVSLLYEPKWPETRPKIFGGCHSACHMWLPWPLHAAWAFSCCLRYSLHKHAVFSALYHFLANFPRTRVILAKEELGVTGQAAALWPPRGRAGPPHPADWRIPRAHHRLVSLCVKMPAFCEQQEGHKPVHAQGQWGNTERLRGHREVRAGRAPAGS